jgi:hypothetical protein
VDTFQLQCADLGKLSSLKIGHNNRGLSSDWHLAKVEVVNTATGEAAVFPHRDWLNKAKGLSVLLNPDVDGDGQGDVQAAGAKVEYVVSVVTTDTKCVAFVGLAFARSRCSPGRPDTLSLAQLASPSRF